MSSEHIARRRWLPSAEHESMIGTLKTLHSPSLPLLLVSVRNLVLLVAVFFTKRYAEDLFTLDETILVVLASTIICLRATGASPPGWKIFTCYILAESLLVLFLENALPFLGAGLDPRALPVLSPEFDSYAILYMCVTIVCGLPAAALLLQHRLLAMKK